MSVKDVIKKSVLESDMYNQAISAGTIFTMVADLIAAVIMGLLIYEVYKKYYRGVVFSRNYALTLVGMTVLTSMVTLAISTNIRNFAWYGRSPLHRQIPHGNQGTA